MTESKMLAEIEFAGSEDVPAVGKEVIAGIEFSPASFGYSVPSGYSGHTCGVKITPPAGTRVNNTAWKYLHDVSFLLPDGRVIAVTRNTGRNQWATRLRVFEVASSEMRKTMGEWLPLEPTKQWDAIKSGFMRLGDTR